MKDKIKERDVKDFNEADNTEINIAGIGEIDDILDVVSQTASIHIWEKCPAGCWFIRKIISPHCLDKSDSKF